MQPLTSVEICAGAGGQALGLAMAGFAHVALVEYEQDYCQVLKDNRPEWNVICADVHDFDGRPYHGVDLLAAVSLVLRSRKLASSLGKMMNAICFPRQSGSLER